MPVKQGTFGTSPIYKGIDKIGKIYNGENLVYQSVIVKDFFVKFIEDSLDDGWIREEYFEDIDKIRMYAFYNKTSVTRIDLPTTITRIYSYAFYNCENLKEINLNSGLLTIGDACFSNNDSIVSIVIPSTVTSVGSSFMTHCPNLETVKFLSTTPPKTTTSPFDRSEKLSRIEVPTGSLSSYQTADYWSEFADLMVEV